MKGKMMHSRRRGHIRNPVIWGRAKNERRTGVVDVRLWRGNQRRVILYCISDLSFYKFWERAWKIFERIREEEAMTGSKADYLLLLLPTVYSKVFTQQLLLLVLFQLVPGLFSLVKKQIFRNSLFFLEKKINFPRVRSPFTPPLLVLGG